MLAMPLEMTAKTSNANPVNVAHPKLSIVLIEPIVASFPDHQFLMMDESYRVTSVRDNRELSMVSGAESFVLAVISDTLGNAGLIAATRSVRKQWPAARIVVVGRASFIVEDYLYDDVVPHSCGQQDFCDTLSRISAQQTHGRPFIVTTPASEYESMKRRNSASEVNSRVSDAPERMTQMRTRV